METSELVKKALAALESAADEKRRKASARSHPTSMRIIGVRVPELRKVVVSLYKQVSKWTAAEVVPLVDALLETNALEARQVAFELLDRHRAARESLRLEDIERLGEGMDNWVTTDTFAEYVAGAAWREQRIDDEVVRGWTRSRDRWWRRTAVVCTIALNKKARGATGDPVRTLDICERVVADRDDMVVKGLSWALRELSKREPHRVLAFLDAHTDELAARVKREVRRKLETGRKP